VYKSIYLLTYLLTYSMQLSLAEKKTVNQLKTYTITTDWFSVPAIGVCTSLWSGVPAVRHRSCLVV